MVPHSEGGLQIKSFKLLSVFEIADTLLGPTLTKSINKIQADAASLSSGKEPHSFRRQASPLVFIRHVQAWKVTIRDFALMPLSEQHVKASNAVQAIKHILKLLFDQPGPPASVLTSPEYGSFSGTGEGINADLCRTVTAPV